MDVFNVLKFYIPRWAFDNVGQYLIDKNDLDIPTVAVNVDETLHDAFVSMFENIVDYIHTKNSIISIFTELYT